MNATTDTTQLAVIEIGAPKATTTWIIEVLADCIQPPGRLNGRNLGHWR